MKRHKVAWTATAILMVVVALVALLATRSPAKGATEVRSPLLGHPAPPVNGSTLSDRHASLSQFAGDYVVVNFWASWCGPCKTEAPDLVTTAWAERTHPVRFLGVVWQDQVAQARSFARTYGLTFPSIVDDGGQIANSYGVTGPPTTFIIGPTGRVLVSLVGATTSHQLESVLRRVGA